MQLVTRTIHALLGTLVVLGVSVCAVAADTADGDRRTRESVSEQPDEVDNWRTMTGRPEWARAFEESAPDETAVVIPVSTVEVVPEPAELPVVAAEATAPFETKRPALLPDVLAELPPSPPSSPAINAAEIGRIAAATGFVAVLTVVGAYALRHLRLKGYAGRGIAPELTLHGSVSLGARNGLHLIRVLDRKFLVAVDSRGISSVTAVSAEFDDGGALAESTEGTDVRNSALLSHLLSAGGG